MFTREVERASAGASSLWEGARKRGAGKEMNV